MSLMTWIIMVLIILENIFIPSSSSSSVLMSQLMNHSKPIQFNAISYLELHLMHFYLNLHSIQFNCFALLCFVLLWTKYYYLFSWFWLCEFILCDSLTVLCIGCDNNVVITMRMTISHQIVSIIFPGPFNDLVFPFNDQFIVNQLTNVISICSLCSFECSM